MVWFHPGHGPQGSIGAGAHRELEVQRHKSAPQARTSLNQELRRVFNFSTKIRSVWTSLRPQTADFFVLHKEQVTRILGFAQKEHSESKPFRSIKQRLIYTSESHKSNIRAFTLFRFPGPVLIMVYKLSPELFESGRRESILLDWCWIMPEWTKDRQLFLVL